MGQYATFYLGRDPFGISILTVQEITKNPEVHPVQLAPDFVRGLVNLRGQVVTVLDVGVRLGMEPREITPQSSLIIIKTNQALSEVAHEAGIVTCDDSVGILADRIGDVVSADDADIEPPPANAMGVELGYLEGVYKMEGALLTILNVGRLLAPPSKTEIKEGQ